MGLVFHPSTNSISRITAAAIVPALVLLGLAVWKWQYSQFDSLVGYAQAQPVPFSHKHHVAGLGIDCRYCHTSVEVSNTANVPPTQICMNCHQQIWTNAALLQPVRDSMASGVPIRWSRVNVLPDYVFFNHSIHVNKGIGCATCHGQVDQMPLTAREATLHMSWCLDCHRNPEKYIRPKDAEFVMNYLPSERQSILGPRLVKQYHIAKNGLTDCVTCHR